MLTTIRRRTTASIVDKVYETMGLVSARLPPARPELHGLSRERDVPYRPTGLPEHTLDVYRPTQHPGRLPIVLYAHGGAFRALSKDTHWLMGLMFARRGFVCFNVNYRLAPRHRFPAAIEDACHAYTWIAENAERYGGDLSRVVLAGESAGGNLVTGLAVAATHRRQEPWARAVFDTGVVPVAVAPVCGMLQVSDPARFSRRRRMPRWLMDQIDHCAIEYLGPPGAVSEGALDLADPLRVIERNDPPDRPLPAFFTAVGTKDPLLDDSRRLKRALDARGVPNHICYYPGEMHAFHALIWRKNARACWRTMFKFLEDHVHAEVISRRAVELRRESYG